MRPSPDNYVRRLKESSVAGGRGSRGKGASPAPTGCRRRHPAMRPSPGNYVRRLEESSVAGGREGIKRKRSKLGGKRERDMNDYCKIGARANPSAKARSIDFSDLSFSPPQTPKFPIRYSSVCKAAAPQDRPADEPFPEEDGTAGERFGVILSRNCSSASRRFRAPERGPASSATLQAAVRRAFSMRKSSSVTEGYRRIHDTAEDDGDGDCDGNAMSRLYQPQQQEARAPRKKRGKIVRACKRIFGF